jgi:hypothetical protein
MIDDSQFDNTPVNPLLLAEKLRRAQDFELPDLAAELCEQPRLREALWFIQWASRSENYPGGLRRFAAKLIDDSQDWIGSDLMIAHPVGAVLSQKEVEEIILAMPDSVRDDLPGFAELSDETVADAFIPRLPLDFDERYESAESRAYRLAEAERRRDAAREVNRNLRAERARLIKETNLPQLVRLCSDIAHRRLAQYLKNLCERADVRFTREKFDGKIGGRAPWYFARISTALLRFMDQWAEKQRASIAETSTVLEMWQWLDWAHDAKRAVMFQGETRHGKTEALSAWCRMRPGAARFIRTPPEAGGLAEFLRWIARELGLDVRPNAPASSMRPNIEFVLRYSGFLCAFDEFQYCVPEPSSRKSPDRLDFVRSYLLDADAKVPCAFVCTEQGYNNARNRYVKATGYVIAQLEERIRTVKLSEEVSSADLTAIARFHLPQLDERLIKLVVSMAIVSRRGYVSDLRKIADDVERLAKAAGAAVPELPHVLAAIEGIYPGSLAQLNAAAKPANDSGTPAPSRRRSSRTANAFGNGPAAPLQTPVRDVAPVMPGVRFESQQDSEEPNEAGL